MTLSEANEIDALKILAAYCQTVVFTGMILFVLSEALTVSNALFCWQSVCFLSLKWYDVMIL